MALWVAVSGNGPDAGARSQDTDALESVILSLSKDQLPEDNHRFG